MFILKNVIYPKDGFEIEKAISFLVIHYNKSGYNSKPVILHSLRIAIILMEMGCEKKIIIASILHDIIEDTEVTLNQLKKEFGQEISDLVRAVSYDKTIVDSIEQYKDMYKRVVEYGKAAVVLKPIDIAVNSLYIHLIKDIGKQNQLVEKGRYFLNLIKEYTNEPACQLLKTIHNKEVKRLS